MWLCRFFFFVYTPTFQSLQTAPSQCCVLADSYLDLDQPKNPIGGVQREIVAHSIGSPIGHSTSKLQKSRQDFDIRHAPFCVHHNPVCLRCFLASETLERFAPTAFHLEHDAIYTQACIALWCRYPPWEGAKRDSHSHRFECHCIDAWTSNHTTTHFRTAWWCVWDPAPGSTIFTTGDIKRSIEGWRRVAAGQRPSNCQSGAFTLCEQVSPHFC